MSVTPVWVTGLEEGTTAIFTYVSGSSIRTDYKRTGTYSIRSLGVANQYQDLPSTYSQIRVGFHYRIDTLVDAAELLHLQTAAGAANVISVKGDSPAGLELFVNDVSQDTWAGSIPLNAWMNISVDVKVDAAAGWAKVYLDGQEILSFSGNTGSTNVARLYLKGCGSYNYFDDIVVWNTNGEGAAAPADDIRLRPCFPNAQGSHTDGVGSDGDSANNYAHLDEAPPSTSDYVDIDTAAKKDTSGMENVTLVGSPDIPFVALTGYAQKTNAAVNTKLRFMLDDGGSESTGSDHTLGSSYGFFQDIFEVQPDSSNWNETDWNSMEAGFEGREDF